MTNATYGLESSDLTRLRRDVVHKDTTSDLCAEIVVELKTGLYQYHIVFRNARHNLRSTQLLNTLEATVTCLEVQVGSPVVGEVYQI